MKQLIAELDGLAEDMSRDGATGVNTVASASQQLARLERENAALREQVEELDAKWKMAEDQCFDQVGKIGELKRENAALREDKERLDWMEKMRPIAWALGSANCGEYWLLTDIGEMHPEEAEEFATLRAAIDAARKEAQP